MTINRGATARKNTQAIELIISAAPAATRKGVIRGRKGQITLTIAPELPAEVDELANKMGHAALINRAIFERVAA